MAVWSIVIAGGRFSRHSSQVPLRPKRGEGREKDQPLHTPEDKTAARAVCAAVRTFLIIRTYYGLAFRKLPNSFPVLSALNPENDGV